MMIAALACAAVFAAAAVFLLRRGGRIDITNLVEEAFDWVYLPWAGVKKKFQLRKLNLITLLADGYPNTLIADVIAASGEKKEYTPEEAAALLKERSRLYREIASKSMVNPRYDDLLGKIREKAGDNYDFPADFYAGILDYQVKGINKDLKKKRPLSALPQPPNIGKKPLQTT